MIPTWPFSPQVWLRLLFVASSCFCAISVPADPIRVAVIGTDTSHAVAFTELINSPSATGPLANVQVVAAFPGGSPDIASSRDRVDKFADQLQKSGVTIVDSIDEAVGLADAFLLESVDGRVHLEQFRKIAVGKPVFIDKPATASVADFLTIMRIAKNTNTPFFSSSALRFCSEIEAIKSNKKIGKLLGASASSPYRTEPTHPDLFWYGIHGVESLATLLGPGCEEVTRIDSSTGVLLACKWQDGRKGTMWALATGNPVYSFTLYGNKQVASNTGFSGYGNLVTQICTFFETRVAPVSPEETLEVLAIMEAAELSRDREGATVKLAEVIDLAREKSASAD
jgi:hypothetical protein